MADIVRYPKSYRENIRTVSERLDTAAETAFSMILMVSILTDLYPADPRIAEYILADSGLKPEPV